MSGGGGSAEGARGTETVGRVGPPPKTRVANKPSFVAIQKHSWHR